MSVLVRLGNLTKTFGTEMSGLYSPVTYRTFSYVGPDIFVCNPSRFCSERVPIEIGLSRFFFLKRVLKKRISFGSILLIIGSMLSYQ